jgi:hypothetical protein
MSPPDAERGPGQGPAPTIDTAAKQIDDLEGTARMVDLSTFLNACADQVAEDGQRLHEPWDTFRERLTRAHRWSPGAILAAVRELEGLGFVDPRYAKLDNGYTWTPHTPEPDRVADLDAFLATPLPIAIARDVIPGVTRVGHRTIITAPEGIGKSTFLTQIGLQVAVGIHPFTGEEIGPGRVLYIDCENPREVVHERLTALRAVAGDRFDPDRFRVKVTDRQPLNLVNRATFAEVESWVEFAEPDLIVIGPLYKLTDAGLDDEEDAKALASALDGLAKSAALLIEAHVGHEGPRGRRPIRPIGSSLWLRWPEFGLHLAKNGTLTPWREHRVPAAWPTRLERGEPWPWMPPGGDSSHPLEREGVTECVAAIERLLAADPGEEFSKTRVVDALRSAGVNAGHRTVSEALDTLRQNGAVVHRKGPRRADLYRLAEGS